MNRWAMLLTIVAVAALVAVLWMKAAINGPEQRYASLTDEIMATPITVVAPQTVAREAAEVVFGIFRGVDADMSEWKPDSPLSAVNLAAGKHPVEVPDDLRKLVARGIEFGNLTDGAFDLTWAALWGLWDFKADQPRVPDDDEINKRVALIDYRRIVINDEEGSVYLPEEGMMLGLGGIAKGYALDRAAAALRKRGIDSFLISAGGQMMLGGMRSDRPWRVGIRDPRGAVDDYFAYLELTDVSVSSSGDYERYFILDGVRYHHVLDPHTGKPTRGLRSATVVSTDATLADALSTALMVLGMERALELVEDLEGVEAVLVDADGTPHVTRGLAGQLHPRPPPPP